VIVAARGIHEGECTVQASNLEVGMATVLITGCSSGFGLEAALAFARRGDTVCATMRNLAKADALRKRAADEGVEIDLVALDVTDDASVATAIAEIEQRHGTVDVLVNNAGIGIEGAVETVRMEGARALMETNFWGVLRMIRAVLPGMRAQRSGVIVNVSSLAARIPGTMYEGMYAASKHALGALSESLAGEVLPFNIRVVVIEPGFFATEISNNGLNRGSGAIGTAYEADHDWFMGFMHSGVDNGADPRVVADAIVAAVDDAATPLHVAVGDDAAMYLALWEQGPTYEAWMATALPVVEAAIGPRPAPPAP
jgi:NAD(P)-dependent dehydrogenase (short-subunit alcohol dehydrogenase family)